MAILGEEGTVKIIAPWEAQGQAFKVGPGEVQFIGTFEGIMYVETEEERFDTAIFICPAVQDWDTTRGTSRANGRCHIVAPKGNIFARFNCDGKPGSCEGMFTLTGGTERFEGITGSGEMRVRSALSSIMEGVASGHPVKSAAGLAVWPELKFKIPDRE
jgi:hypothetical protein